MFNHKFSPKLLIFLGAIGFGLLMNPSFGLRGQAQSDPQPTNSLNSEILGESNQSPAAFTPPNRGAPDRTADGGARGCGVEIKQLIPDDKWAATMSEHPTFLWYIDPLPPNTEENQKIKALKFVLIEEDKAKVYQKVLSLPDRASIMSLTLSSDEVPALKEGKFYQWYVNAYTIDDEETVKATDLGCYYVSAWIQHQVLTAEQQQELDSLTTAEERLSFYQQHDIWYDALATLDALRRENPDDLILNQQWQQALESVQLSELAGHPPAESIPIVRNPESTAHP